jgi:hypothetical protein
VRIVPVLCLMGSIFLGTATVQAQVADWTVSQPPSISVGDGQGKGQNLLFVQDALLLPDGRLAVLSAGTHDLRIYSPTGAFLRAVGREGEGPGEFKVPRGFSLLPSGHVLVYDPGNLRVTEFDGDFAVAGTRRVAYSLSAMSSALSPSRPMRNGWVPVATYDTPMMEAWRRKEGVYNEDLVIRLFAGSAVEATIRRPRGPVYDAKSAHQGLTLPIPMGDFAIYGWGPEHVVVGSSLSTRFDLYDTSGKLVRSVVAEGTPRPATSADMAAFDRKTRKEHSGSIALGGTKTPSRSTLVERYLKHAPRGDHVPMFDKLEVSSTGRVWVREYALEGDTATWQVLDPDEGGTVARVTVPSSWQILRVSPTHLVVLQRDAYDVEMVRVYAVGR